MSKNYNGTQSFKAKDNQSLEEIELLALKKELTQLRMENDILKQIVTSTVLVQCANFYR